MSQRWLYFVQVQEDGPIKIGMTKHMASRLTTLQTGCPYELKLLHAQPAAASMEAQLHERFSAHHIRGEWFEPARELLLCIAQLTTDASTSWDVQSSAGIGACTARSRAIGIVESILNP